MRAFAPQPTASALSAGSNYAGSNHAGSDYAGPNWSTASYRDASASAPMELAALGEHLSLCQGAGPRWSTLRHVGARLHGFAAARFVTTLAFAALLVAAAMLAL